jgi:hypothetical protein
MKPERLELAEVAGVLEVDRGGRAGQFGDQVGEVQPAAGRVADHLRNRDVARHVLGLTKLVDDGAALRSHVLGHQDLAAAGEPRCHAQGKAGRGAPVISGFHHDVVVEQLSHEAVVLEARLVLAQVGVAAAAVGGQELSPAGNLVADGRHEVGPAAAAQEVEVLGGGDVAVEKALHMTA